MSRTFIEKNKGELKKMDYVRFETGEKVQMLRKRAKMDQASFGRELYKRLGEKISANKSTSRIKKMENGFLKISREELEKIVEILNEKGIKCTIDDLLFDRRQLKDRRNENMFIPMEVIELVPEIKPYLDAIVVFSKAKNLRMLKETIREACILFMEPEQKSHKDKEIANGKK